MLLSSEADECGERDGLENFAFDLFYFRGRDKLISLTARRGHFYIVVCIPEK